MGLDFSVGAENKAYTWTMGHLVQAKAVRSPHHNVRARDSRGSRTSRQETTSCLGEGDSEPSTTANELEDMLVVISRGNNIA
ncbi:hypothetical protein VTN00DRAFT_6984 [Thermoascus crustaceus]|uniref:uncharacterized protein n=1 Tax=Thermoascus crustaceus TaxID=5088 RepID=UPI0037449A0B